jgi:hypothetical protein
LSFDSPNAEPMSKSTSTVLIAIAMILTFPIWIGLAGGVFGLIGGLFGIVIGVIGAVFGAIAGLIGAVFSGIGWFFDLIFGGIFGWDDHFFYPPRFLTLLALVLLVVFISRKQNQKSN